MRIVLQLLEMVVMDVHLFTVKNSNLLAVLMAVLVVVGEM